MVGRSLIPFLQNQPVEGWRDKMFTQTNGNELYAIQRSVFTKTRKMTYNGFDYSEMYDPEKDPHEMVNLINDPEYADDVRRMMGDIWRFARDTGDTRINPYLLVRFAPLWPRRSIPIMNDSTHSPTGGSFISSTQTLNGARNGMNPGSQLFIGKFATAIVTLPPLNSLRKSSQI